MFYSQRINRFYGERGKRIQRGKGKKYEDNFEEWTGLEINESQKAVHNREQYRKLVSISVVVFQGPSCLSD